MTTLNTSHIFIKNKLDTTLINDNPERHPLDNYSAKVNMQHTFKPEQQLSVNVDYIHFKDANTLTYLNDFYDGSGTFLYSDRTRSNEEMPITFWIATADYAQKIGKKMHSEAGLKSTFSPFVNAVRVE